MGLFDFFLSEEKKIAKHIRCLTHVDSQPEDREASAHWLANLGNPTGLVGLLQRFDMNLEHRLKDSGEKDMVYDLLRQQQAQAIEPTKIWLTKCKQVSIPLQLLAELAGEDKTLPFVFELLGLELQKDDFKPARKRTLLIWLSKHTHPDIIQVTTPFLDDFDEGVRVAAVEVLLAQRSDDARLPLLGLLANPEDDSNRLKMRLAQAFYQRRWSVQDAPPTLAETLPNAWMVQGTSIVPNPEAP